MVGIQEAVLLHHASFLEAHNRFAVNDSAGWGYQTAKLIDAVSEISAEKVKVFKEKEDAGRSHNKR